MYPNKINYLIFVAAITLCHFSHLWAVTKTLVFSRSSTKEEWFRVNFFFIQNHPSNSFLSFPFIEISDFHIYFVFYFVISSSSCDVGLFVVFVRRCLSFLFLSGICSVQIIRSASIQCRSNQWLWRYPHYRSGDMVIPKI